MKINAKIISEKVDHYIDLMLECECEEPDQNEIISGAEPEEGEKQKSKIIDDLVDEELELLNDDEDDIDSEKDLNAEDGKTPDEEDVEEGIGTAIWHAVNPAAKKAAEIAAKNARKKMLSTVRKGAEIASNTRYA